MKTKPATRFDMQRVGENLYRNKSSAIYYAFFKRGGKQIRKSLKTTEKEVARRYLADKRCEVQRLTTGDAKPLPFAEYERNAENERKHLSGGRARRWLDTAAVNLKPASLDRRLRTIHSLTPYFKDKTVGGITKLDVEHWATARVTKCNPRTFNMELETLNLCFKYAIEHGIGILQSGTPRMTERDIENGYTADQAEARVRDLTRALAQETLLGWAEATATRVAVARRELPNRLPCGLGRKGGPW